MFNRLAIVAGLILTLNSFSSAGTIGVVNPETGMLDLVSDIYSYAIGNGTLIRFDPANDGDWQFEITETSTTSNNPLTLKAGKYLEILDAGAGNYISLGGQKSKMYFGGGNDYIMPGLVKNTALNFYTNNIKRVEIATSSMTVNVPLYLGSNDLTIAEGKLANSTIVSADIKDGEIVAADMTAATTGWFVNWANFANVPAGFADGTDDTGGAGAAALMVAIDGVKVSSPTIAISFENVFNGLQTGNTSYIFVSTAAVTNGDTTHLCNGDQIYDFVLAESFGGDVTGTIGATVVTDDSHAHVLDNIDDFTEAALEAKLSDVTDIYTNLDGTLISTAAVTNGDATHIPTCDHVFDFCETTQAYLQAADLVGANETFGAGWNADTGVPEKDDIYDAFGTIDFAVCIASPVALGTGYVLVSPFRGYAVTITTITAQIQGGTNYVFMVEQRTMAGIESAGTDIWSGDLTALPTYWKGATSSDFTVPANSALVLVPTSISGDVGRLMIKGQLTRWKLYSRQMFG